MERLKNAARIVAGLSVMVAVTPLVTSLIVVSAYYNRRERRFSHLHYSL